MINSYKQLTVWQKSFKLSLHIFKITSKFPNSELYGMVSQMRRASVSIPSNIAEGSARGYRQEYIQFLKTSFGSGAELETQLLLAQELGYISSTEFEQVNDLLSEVMKMLNKLITILKK